MPRGVRLGAASPQVCCNHRPEMVHPAPNGFIGDRNAAFRQQIFDVAKAQGEPQIEPDCPPDDFSREPVAFVANFPHPLGYLTEGEAASSNRCDNARATIADDLKGRKVALGILDFGIDTSTASGLHNLSFCS